MNLPDHIATFYEKHNKIFLECQKQLLDNLNNSRNLDLIQKLENSKKFAYPYQEYLSHIEDLSVLQQLASEVEESIKKDLQDQEKVIEESIKNLEFIYNQAHDFSEKKQSMFIEIHPGTGGDEAILFSNDLFSLYFNFSNKKKWKVDIQSNNIESGIHIIKISGKGCLYYLEMENGVHRVQRIPTTETKGRVHTSTVVVNVIPQYPEIHNVEIKPQDLKIDTYRSSGPGGQHVNKTDSAVRITHIPTGLKTESQNNRSQGRNKVQALEQLQAKLEAHYRALQQKDMSALRTEYSGLRSEKIRTYNFNQKRVTDHRINLSIYKLDEFMAGDFALLGEELVKRRSDILGEDDY